MNNSNTSQQSNSTQSENFIKKLLGLEVHEFIPLSIVAVLGSLVILAISMNIWSIL
jgi:hypothetical protein